MESQQSRSQRSEQALVQAGDVLASSYHLLEAQVASLKQELLGISHQRLSELTHKEVLAARLAALFDVLPGGVIVLDTEGRIIESNRQAQDYFQKSLMGRLWREVLSEEVMASPLEMVQQGVLLRNGILLQSGYVVSVSTTSLADANGQIILLTDQTPALKKPPGRGLSESASSLSRSKGVVDVSSVIALSPSSRQILRMAERVARSDCSVLISGESGTGKEVIARYLHAHSARSEMPFIAINCAAIPESMLEALLFGHEKGAFTGAHQSSAGKFEQANGGTLLLDEISEMSPLLQAKLLRVLQEREVERVGGKKTIALDLRIFSTSNRHLPDAIAAGAFREDLYYRLSVFPLVLPPLRERKEDILPLAHHFLHRYVSGPVIPTLSPAAVQQLLCHPWPGNVRELENVMQRALVVSESSIEAQDLMLLPCGINEGLSETDTAAPAIGRDMAEDLPTHRRQQEYEMIWSALQQAGDVSRKELACQLGISERSLRYKLAAMRDGGYDVDRYTH